MQIVEVKAVYAFLYPMTIPVPLFFAKNEIARTQDIFHSMCKSMQIFHLSYTFFISAVYFHGLCAVWVLFNFRKSSERWRKGRTIEL